MFMKRCLLFSHSWGESAGAISVANHLLTNNGDTEGLFRAAFMESGSPLPAGEVEDGIL
jgi:acetylcholinesterase